MRPHGGPTWASIRCRLHRSFGSKVADDRAPTLKRRSHPKAQCRGRRPATARHRRETGMASRHQITANRRNARKSTGPRTSTGKLRSRSNALKHGLTAETVITVFENGKDYEAFERAMMRDYAPRSAIEQELVARLASLLWRLRRATAIETGLFSIQGRILQDRRTHQEAQTTALNDGQIRLREMFGLGSYIGAENKGTEPAAHAAIRKTSNYLEPLARTEFVNPIGPVRGRAASLTPQLELLAQCFLRVSRLDDRIFERISRYEVSLWRQTLTLLGKLQVSRTAR